jgi:hypothetical protein
VIMADAYSGYEFLEKESGVTLALCLSHVRRKFFDARDSYPRSDQMLDLIEEIYSLEHVASDFNELRVIRMQKTRIVVDRMWQWMQDQSGRYLINSTIGKVCLVLTWMVLVLLLSCSGVTRRSSIEEEDFALDLADDSDKVNDQGYFSDLQRSDAETFIRFQPAFNMADIVFLSFTNEVWKGLSRTMRVSFNQSRTGLGNIFVRLKALSTTEFGHWIGPKNHMIIASRV